MKKEDHHGRRTFRRLFIFKQSEGPIDHRQARWRRRDPNSKKPKKISTRLPRRFPTRNEGEEEKDMGIVKRPIRVQRVGGSAVEGRWMGGVCFFEIPTRSVPLYLGICLCQRESPIGQIIMRVELRGLKS